MGLEVQQKVINPLIKDTANHIRQISSSLIPLIMLSGKQNDGIMQYLSSFGLMSNDTAELIDHLELTDAHKRFDAAYVIPEYSTNFLLNLERFLESWDSSNRLSGRPRGSKVVNFTPPEPIPLNNNDETPEYHLDPKIKSSRLLPQQAVTELFMEYLDLYRIPESDYIDKLLAEYIPKIEEAYSSIHGSLNIDHNIKVLTLIIECLQKVSNEYKKYYDEDDEWI